MTNYFEEEAQALQEVLEDMGIRVFDVVPDVFQPPAAVIYEGSPWVRTEDTNTPGEFTVRMTIRLVVKAGTNAKQVSDLRSYTQSIVQKVLASGFGFDGVDQPEEWAVQGTTYLVTNITVTTTIRFT